MANRDNDHDDNASELTLASAESHTKRRRSDDSNNANNVNNIVNNVNMNTNINAIGGNNQLMEENKRRRGTDLEENTLNTPLQDRSDNYHNLDK